MLNRRVFLNGLVTAIGSSSLILEASSEDVQRFGKGDQIIATKDTPEFGAFSLNDPMLFNRKGEPVAVVGAARLWQGPAFNIEGGVPGTVDTRAYYLIAQQIGKWT